MFKKIIEKLSFDLGPYELENPVYGECEGCLRHGILSDRSKFYNEIKDIISEVYISREIYTLYLHQLKELSGVDDLNIELKKLSELFESIRNIGISFWESKNISTEVLRKIRDRLHGVKFVLPQPLHDSTFVKSKIIDGLEVLDHEKSVFADYIKVGDFHRRYFSDYDSRYMLLSTGRNEILISAMELQFFLKNKDQFIRIMAHELGHTSDVFELYAYNDFTLPHKNEHLYSAFSQCIRNIKFFDSTNSISEIFADRFEVEIIGSFVDYVGDNHDFISLKSELENIEKTDYFKHDCRYLALNNKWSSPTKMTDLAYELKGEASPYPEEIVRIDYIQASHSKIEKFLGCSNVIKKEDQVNPFRKEKYCPFFE